MLLNNSGPVKANIRKIDPNGANSVDSDAKRKKSTRTGRKLLDFSMLLRYSIG